MPLIAVDHSANLEDGLYTGEECVMRDESWDLEDGLYTGEGVHIEPVLVSREDATLTSERRTEMNRTHLDDACGVEVELNLESLSFRGDERDDRSDHIVCTSVEGAEVLKFTREPEDDARTRAEEGWNDSLEQPEDTAIEEPARRSNRQCRETTRRSKLSIIGRQLVAKAASRLKSMAKLPASPSARKALEGSDDGMMATKDDATCALTHSSRNSTLGSSSCPSSITVSTCDFPAHVNQRAVLERYRKTNAWEAAREGDYATLFYILQNDGRASLMREDGEGRVPLNYAATSYGRSSFGKWGLEAVKLLLDAWPNNVELPRALVRQCEMRHGLLHSDVLEVLSRELSRREQGKSRSRYYLLFKRAEKEEVEIDGLEDVAPTSFMEDLGDDGALEDY